MALAHLARRAILQRLSKGEARVTALAEPFAMSLNDVSKHIHVLERACLATQTRGSREFAYSPELVGRDVVFTDYEIVAGKRDSFGKSECGEVLKKFYRAVAKRDLAAARTYLADDLAFVGLVQTYRSADEYLKALAGLLQVTVRLDVKGIISQGNDAAIFFDLETKAPAEGKVLVTAWHQFKDGKISHVRSAFDGRPYATMFTGAASR